MFSFKVWTKTGRTHDCNGYGWVRVPTMTGMIFPMIAIMALSLAVGMSAWTDWGHDQEIANLKDEIALMKHDALLAEGRLNIKIEKTIDKYIRLTKVVDDMKSNGPKWQAWADSINAHLQVHDDRIGEINNAIDYYCSRISGNYLEIMTRVNALTDRVDEHHASLIAYSKNFYRIIMDIGEIKHRIDGMDQVIAGFSKNFETVFCFLEGDNRRINDLVKASGDLYNFVHRPKCCPIQRSPCRRR